MRVKQLRQKDYESVCLRADQNVESQFLGNAVLD
jgi:hypothetical protein